MRIAVVALVALCLHASAAMAQTDDDYAPPQRDFRSPEWMTAELRIGPYTPDVGNDAFGQAFPGDNGLLLGLELEVIAYRWRDIAYFNIGGSIGHASYSGGAFDIQGNRVDEKTSFILVPVSALAVLRVDALARKLRIPLIFTGKIGHRWAVWSTSTGERTDADGVSTGLTWALQAALDLDFFDRRAARVMDEEWGINHTFLFFEINGSETFGNDLPLDDTTWATGLGFVF